MRSTVSQTCATMTAQCCSATALQDCHIYATILVRALMEAAGEAHLKSPLDRRGNVPARPWRPPSRRGSHPSSTQVYVCRSRSMRRYGKSLSMSGSKSTMWSWRDLMLRCDGGDIRRLRASRPGGSGSACTRIAAAALLKGTPSLFRRCCSSGHLGLCLDLVVSQIPISANPTVRTKSLLPFVSATLRSCLHAPS